MIEKRIVDKIYINEKNKEGQVYLTKPTERFPNGKPFKRVVVQFAGDNIKYSNNSFNQEDEFLKWKSGDEVEVLLEQNGDFWNFSIPGETDGLMQRVAELEEWKQRVAPFLNIVKEILYDQIKNHNSKELSKESL